VLHIVSEGTLVEWNWPAVWLAIPNLPRQQLHKLRYLLSEHTRCPAANTMHQQAALLSEHTLCPAANTMHQQAAVLWEFSVRTYALHSYLVAQFFTLARFHSMARRPQIKLKIELSFIHPLRFTLACLKTPVIIIIIIIIFAIITSIITVVIIVVIIIIIIIIIIIVIIIIVIIIIIGTALW